MSKWNLFFLASMLLLGFYSNSAQNAEDPFGNIQRDFSVKFPLGNVYAGQTIEVELKTRHSLIKPSDYKIEWNIVGGKIIDGQGTPIIKIETDENADELEVRADILDFDVDERRASGKIELIKRPKAVLVKEVDSFLSLNSSDLTKIIQDYSDKIVENTSAKANVYIYPKNNNNFSKIRNRLIASFQEAKIDISKINIVRKANSNNNRVRFYVVPTGAEMPF